MPVYLLDVNALVALMWPEHEAHSRVSTWFAPHAQAGWATCSFTQAGFVRVISNPAFSPHAVTVAQGLQLLARNIAHRAHRFWPDTEGFAEIVKPLQPNIRGHRQLTDAYLVGLALRRRGVLATLDRSITALLPDKRAERSCVQLLA